MKILLAAATETEIRPTINWLRAQDASVQEGIDILINGVGIMAATFSLTQALYSSNYDFVLGAGIAGAFDRSISLGECVVAGSEQMGDLGAEDHDEFLDVFTLGLQQENQTPFTGSMLMNEMNHVPFPISHLRRVSGITVNTVSGSAPTIAARSARYGAHIETMEGAALHYVCLKMGKPFLQLRAISNYVTPRDRAAWKIGEAVTALNKQLIAWLGSPA